MAKTIELKTVLIGGQKTSIKELIKLCANAVPTDGAGSPIGFTVDEMRSRIRILDALEKSNEVLELEDADYSKLTECVRKMKWAIVDVNIISFCDQFNV